MAMLIKDQVEVMPDFDIAGWLRHQAGAHRYSLAIPKIDVSNKIADDNREWLITNGLGSYASANIWGANTRRYHGLFVAALDPPVSRTLLLTRLDEEVSVEGESETSQLSTNFWQSGIVSPEGFKNVVAFTVYPVPTWVYAVADGFLVKQVAMLPGKQAVYVGYSRLGYKPIDLTLQIMVNHRDFHGETHGNNNWNFQQSLWTTHTQARDSIKAFDAATELVLSFNHGEYRQDSSWYWNYFWPREHERGLSDHEDNFHAGVLKVPLGNSDTVTFCASLVSDAPDEVPSIDEVVKLVANHHNKLISCAGKVNGKLNEISQELEALNAAAEGNGEAPADTTVEEFKQLVLAADNFLVKRCSTESPSIIAGYHWFNDWGRDSMISLSGLCLSTGRPEIARGILKTFGKYVSDGMLPNNFPDSGQTPQYNTADATFWWAAALYKYFAETNDRELVAEQLPLLDSVVDWHVAGTRYGLHLDHVDSLISGGEIGYALTWMDARVGTFAVTPRIGKAVEINALWYNFLRILDTLHAEVTGDKHHRRTIYMDMAECTLKGFEEFWNPELGCLFDVIANNGTKDASVRPNQLFAISLPFELLSDEQAKSVLNVVERDLLTPCGLRTLATNDDNYHYRYGDGREVASQYDRDITYHQGTVWPFLFGPWVDARVKVYGKTEENFRFIREHLAPIRTHVLSEGAIGSISEIFDADAGDETYPHGQKPQGCIAQAWSVAELLRILKEYPQLQE